MNPQTTAHTNSSFHREVSRAFDAVRTGFMDLLAALPPVQRPAELSRVLGIDYTMSRKAVRLAEATDLYSAALEVPRPAAMPRILKAAAKKGVGRDVLHRLDQAVDNYESLAKRHGGDRATFDAMLSGNSPDAAERISHEAKRAAYRANTQLLGRQVDTALFFIAVRPSTRRDGYLESIWICAQFGLKRFHPSASLEVITTRFTVARPDGPVEWPTIPIQQSEAFHSESFLIKEFCTQPLPGLQPLPEQEAGFRRFEFQSEEIGLQSAVDCVTAQLVHTPRPRIGVAGRRLFGLQGMLDVPTSLLMLDIYVHKSLVSPEEPLCYSASNSVSTHAVLPDEPDPSILLPVQERAEVLGYGPAVARTKELPRYDELIRHVFEKMEWSDPDLHQLVRCKVDYPILNTHHVLRVPIAES